MNLAYRDIRHNWVRFLLTAFGISLLLMLVMGMGGIYRGLIMESTLIIDTIDADIWVVQKDTKGPFAEVSKIPRNLEDRLATIPGVESSNAFLSHVVQRDYRDRVLRLTVQGLGWPRDDGSWLPLFRGRPFVQGHYEMIADQSAGLPIGSRVKLGKETYTVVGITQQMNSPAGDAMVFVSLNDAIAIQTDQTGELIREERSARLRRFVGSDFGNVNPNHATQITGYAKNLPALGTVTVSAILVKARPGYPVSEILEKINTLPNVTAYDCQGQRDIMLRGLVARSGRQLLLFRTVLIIVSTVIIALILYTLTLDKLHDIAMLKLIGARNRVIIGLVMQQALYLGVVGFGVGLFIGQYVYPFFPRRVVLVEFDLWVLFGIVVVISVLASSIGIIKALRVDPGEILS